MESELSHGIDGEVMSSEERDARYLVAGAGLNVGEDGTLEPAEEIWDAFAFDELTEIMKGLYWGEEPEELDDLAEHPLGVLWDERKSIMGIIAAAKQVKEQIEKVMARKLGPAGSGRFDEYQVKVSIPRKLRIIDSPGFVEWVGEDWSDVFNVAPSNIRVKALRAVAEKRGLDPDHALDTFCEYEDGEPKLATVPLDRVAPKWRQLKHGETVNALEE